MRELIEKAARLPVSRETWGRLQRYVELLVEENGRQNLISRTNTDDIWHRHILDCAQLLRHRPSDSATWVDIGSGAGLPGIVVACLLPGRTVLVEPRRLRADFLVHVADELGLEVTVESSKVERVTGLFEVIVARAVAALPTLLRSAAHLSTRNSTWILPKGKSALTELADAKKSWHGTFHVEQSLTDADSRILIGTDVRAKP